jgi:3'-5' exoribonuclease 1
MNYVIVDLESTCWQKRARLERKEIIEIGAVILDATTLRVVREFSSFVRPIKEPLLSDFCRSLTTIRQIDVDQADDFKTVWVRFLEWVGADPFVMYSWGMYDLDHLQVECRRHGVAFPGSFQQHIDLKGEFARVKGREACGMKRALALLGLPLEGTHHRGIDDARNIARIAQAVIPHLEREAEQGAGGGRRR